ncbi:hypothetical protein QBC38DRAFT_465542 [Podospora fimiseda]|uniref:Uncharacterized protein n=1 Tax=Podospora fimiseda TaxID=252190 RepID=A0AAN7BY47_9PEZI|nr:hypothetical protein QBC38DRAFT_465542 [Podospora fimiseda]
MSIKTESQDSKSFISVTSPEHIRFRDAAISFAADISGSTHGPTLTAEKEFVRRISNLLSPAAQFQARVLPWDNSAHPIHSLTQVDLLRARSGTNPCVILASHAHKTALKESSLWFLMTDGLIDSQVRKKFASDVAVHGVHGISCVVVIFGNPAKGRASCDISVGIGVFAVVPNCAFLFCNEITWDLRVMQTKGTFNVLLKGNPHPTFDASTRWDTLPQVSVEDFSDILIPKPLQNLGANEMALQGSLVINMNDFFANRLAPEQVAQIFENPSNLDSLRMTSHSRGQSDQFRHWTSQQTIPLNNPVFKPRPDKSQKAELLFGELIDLVIRGNPPPASLQKRLRAAYRSNMKQFIDSFKKEVRASANRAKTITAFSRRSRSNIDHSTALSPPMSTSLSSDSSDSPPTQSARQKPKTHPTPLEPLDASAAPTSVLPVLPQIQTHFTSLEPLDAPLSKPTLLSQFPTLAQSPGPVGERRAKIVVLTNVPLQLHPQPSGAVGAPQSQNATLNSGPPSSPVVVWPSLPQPLEPLDAPRSKPASRSSAPLNSHREKSENAWGSWEKKTTDDSLRGLLYTTGFRATSGSFKGTCSLCNTSRITLAWLFCAPGIRGHRMPPAADPSSTSGLPLPGSHTRLDFPLAMGHFPEISRVLAQPPSVVASSLTPNVSQQQGQPTVPMLVCDPCSVFYSNDTTHNLRIIAALPMVSFAENRNAIYPVLNAAFEGRFAENALPQVFLSVLMLLDSQIKTSNASQPTASSEGKASSDKNFDVAGAVAAARASKTFREAVEWIACDLLDSTTMTWENSRYFSSPLSDVLTRLFNLLDTMGEGGGIDLERSLVVDSPSLLVRYPPQGFVVALKLASLIKISVDLRRRAAFRRLLYSICEEIEKLGKTNEDDTVLITAANLRSAVETVGELVGKQVQFSASNQVGLQEEKEPQSSVSMESLIKANLLSEEVRGTLSQAEEFKELEQLPWFGPALALFLHGLYWVSATNLGVLKLATESYGAVWGVGVVSKALEKPEEVTGDVVKEIVGAMTPPASHTMSTNTMSPDG